LHGHGFRVAIQCQGVYWDSITPEFCFLLCLKGSGEFQFPFIHKYAA